MAHAKEIHQEQLLELAPAEREEVAEEAIRSLEDTTHGELSPAWEQEIERRAKELDEGRADLIPSEEVFRRIEAELRDRRGRR